MKSKIRILIADDHAFLRMGLTSYLASVADMDCVGEATNGKAAVELARRLRPDVIIMDLMMPEMNGAEATRVIRSELPDVRIVILTTYGTSRELAQAIAHGATGVVMKDAEMGSLIETVRKVAAGDTALPKLDSARDPQLSPRQQEMLTAITKGLSNAEIGQLFGISGVTVKKHLSVVFSKIGAANRSDAVAIALRENLV